MIKDSYYLNLQVLRDNLTKHGRGHKASLTKADVVVATGLNKDTVNKLYGSLFKNGYVSIGELAMKM